MELRTSPRRGRRRRRVGWWACGLLCAAGSLASAGPASQNARAERPSREEVEAAYLYNFGKFVRWPGASQRGPLVICVAARDLFAGALRPLVAGEQINQRALQVRKLENPDEVAGCSILFVGSGDPARIDGLLKAAADKPILTVGDAPDFLVRGGTIQFVLMEDHVRFSVNLSAADRCGLSLSSELLKVAVSVTSRPQKGGAR